MNAKLEDNKAQLETDRFFVALDRVIQPNTTNYQPLIEFDVSRRKGKTVPKGITVLKAVQPIVHNKPKQAKRAKTAMAAVLSEDSMQPRQFSFSLIDTVESARSGVRFNDFKTFYKLLNLSNKKWAEIIGVSEKTMQNILKHKRFLDRNKSERLLNFLLLVKYGLEVFDDKDSFEQWLKYDSPILNGKTPMDYLDTIQGINMLKEVLFKIESGNLV